MFDTIEPIDSFKGEFHWLSNMTPIKPFIVEGISYNTVENYYQAQKTDAVGRRLQISKMDPYESRTWGKALTLRAGWHEGLREQHMEYAVRQKFSQDKFYNLLLNTGTRELIEGNHHNDTFWGRCLKTGKGKNKLGELIMKIRTEYLEELEAQEHIIEAYPNIKKKMNEYDYKHMDSVVVLILQSKFIKQFDQEHLELIDSLLDFDQQKLFEESFNNTDLADRLRAATIVTAVTDFTSEFDDYFKATNYTVKIK